MKDPKLLLYFGAEVEVVVVAVVVLRFDGGNIIGKFPLFELVTLTAWIEDGGGGGGTDKNTEGSSTNKGYKLSTILNFVAKSFALAKVILYIFLCF